MPVGVDTHICKKVNCSYYIKELDYRWGDARCVNIDKGMRHEYVADYDPIPIECPYKAIMIASSKHQTRWRRRQGQW